MSYTISTVLEILALVLIIVGFCNEQRLVKFEDKLFARIKRQFSKKQSRCKIIQFPSQTESNSSANNINVKYI